MLFRHCAANLAAAVNAVNENNAAFLAVTACRFARSAYTGYNSPMAMTLVITTLMLLGSSEAAFKFDTPAGWVAKAPSSSMRVADFTLPKVAGDPEDATTTIFFFGAQQGGSVQANMDRWIGQMAQPDGKPSKSVAKASSLTSHGLKISVVDVSGPYVAETAPGSGQNFNKPGFRQIAAVVETPGGNYYVKLTGPAKTVAKWQQSYFDLLKTLRYE